MALSQRINQVGENPYLPKLMKLHNTGIHVQLLQWGSTLPLVSPGFDGSIAEKSREKVELLSLEFLIYLFLFPFLSLFSLSFPPSNRLGQVGSRELSSHATCPILIGHLGFPYPLIHLPWISIHSQGAMCLLWPHT